eukprot:6605451-Pyramimonas_sp.AAC.3
MASSSPPTSPGSSARRPSDSGAFSLLSYVWAGQCGHYVLGGESKASCILTSFVDDLCIFARALSFG